MKRMNKCWRRVLGMAILVLSCLLVAEASAKPSWAGKKGKGGSATKEDVKKLDKKSRKELKARKKEAKKKAEKAKERAEKEKEEAEDAGDKAKGKGKKKAKDADAKAKGRKGKTEADMKELDKGSERGKEARSGRRKWWKLWGDK